MPVTNTTTTTTTKFFHSSIHLDLVYLDSNTVNVSLCFQYIAGLYQTNILVVLLATESIKKQRDKSRPCYLFAQGFLPAMKAVPFVPEKCVPWALNQDWSPPNLHACSGCAEWT